MTAAPRKQNGSKDCHGKGTAAMVQIRPEEMGAEQAYRLLVGIVVPRPIAWVTTISPNGGVNLAPFSCFTFVSPKPPMLAVSIGRKSGVYKDTARNILATEEFVVNIADSTLLDPLHQSSAEYPSDVSEIEELNVPTAPAKIVRPPLVQAAPISMECRFRNCFEFGETRTRLIVGEVVLFHIRDGLLVDGKIETAALDPVARLGGPKYAMLGEIVTMRSVFQTSKGEKIETHPEA